jgi:hypothetical protein
LLDFTVCETVGDITSRLGTADIGSGGGGVCRFEGGDDERESDKRIAGAAFCVGVILSFSKVADGSVNNANGNVEEGGGDVNGPEGN